MNFGVFKFYYFFFIFTIDFKINLVRQLCPKDCLSCDRENRTTESGFKGGEKFLGRNRITLIVESQFSLKSNSTLPDLDESVLSIYTIFR